MAWSCEQCGRYVTNNTLMCDLCGSAAPGADPQRVALGGQRDLVMEAHLRALALWQRIGAVMIAAAALYGVIALMTAGSHDPIGRMFTSILYMLIGIGLVAAAGSYVLGHFLARYSNVARIIAGVLMALSLASSIFRTGALLFVSSEPYGYYAHESYYQSRSSGVGWIVFFSLLVIIWTIMLLWVLFNRRSAKICTEGYRELVARTPELTPPTFKSPFFILPAAAIGILLLLAMVVVLPRLIM